MKRSTARAPDGATQDVAPPQRAAACLRRPAQRGTPERAELSERKRAILLAAERLFAQRGFHGVSIRDIAADAAVPLALVGYHFGSKQQLYEAIFESWRPMIDDRLRQLETALAESDAAKRLACILDAFVAPVLALQQHPQGRCYAQMAARDLSAPGPQADDIHRRYFDPMARAFIDALGCVFPTATRGRVAWCYQFMLGALLHFMTDRRVERLSDGENRAADPGAGAHLLAFLDAGIRGVLGR